MTDNYVMLCRMCNITHTHTHTVSEFACAGLICLLFTLHVYNFQSQREGEAAICLGFLCSYWIHNMFGPAVNQQCMLIKYE